MKRNRNEQIEWIEFNSQAVEWENMKAFTNAFNSHFGTQRSVDALATVLQKRHIHLNSKCNNNRYTDEQKKWLRNNLDSIEWNNQKHFADTFNALFNDHKTVAAINAYLSKHKYVVKTKHNTYHYTDEMDLWLKNNYDKYDMDFVQMAKDFNSLFNVDFSNCRLQKHLMRVGIHIPRKKTKRFKPKSESRPESAEYRNHGMFKAGHTRTPELPIGTIRHNSDGRPFIKVMLCEGSAGKGEKGHNYREPWWKPLQKKIWEDHYGEVPEGYVVCSLNQNPDDTDIKNIGIVDKRGTAVMAKKGWWTDNRVITGCGVQWCNLYYTAKDNGVL